MARTITGRVTTKPPDGNLGVFLLVRNRLPPWFASSLLSSICIGVHVEVRPDRPLGGASIDPMVMIPVVGYVFAAWSSIRFLIMTPDGTWF